MLHPCQRVAEDHRPVCWSSNNVFELEVAEIVDDHRESCACWSIKEWVLLWQADNWDLQLRRTLSCALSLLLYLNCVIATFSFFLLVLGGLTRQLSWFDDADILACQV